MGAGREQVLREGLQDSTLRRGSGQAQRKQQGTVKGTQVAERPPGCRGGRGEGGERGGRVRPEVGHGRRQNAGKKGSVGWGGAERAGVKMWGCRPDAVHAPPGTVEVTGDVPFRTGSAGTLRGSPSDLLR